MSSKEQYRDALKRQKQINAEMNVNIKNLQEALTRANKQILELRRATIYKKKWWQFWK